MKYFLLFLLISIGTLAQKTKKPNIVIILTDDQGWGDLSINGNTNLSTPHIDNIAKSGVMFEHFYVNPVCSPTRAELLTGRYHTRGGVYSTSQGGERLDLDETTFADIFKKAGYKTAAYGKWHSGMQPPYHPNSRGFEDFYGFCSGHWGNYFSPMLEHNGEIVNGDGFMTDDLTNKGLAFIEKNKDTPFLLYLPFNTPHSPMQVPDKWWKKFENKNLEMKYAGPEKEDIFFTKAALAMCENIDWNVGRITQKLEELQLASNTIVIYLSDNGPNGVRWNGGMKGRKGSTDEGGVRSPFMISWPGKLPKGKKVNQIAGSIDLLPTLTDLAGIQITSKKALDGLSLKSLLIKNKANWPERYIFSHWMGKVSVRSQKFRLDSDKKLYDMENDFGQTKAVNQEFPKIAQTMIRAIAAWEKEVLAELPKIDVRTFPIGHPDYTFTQIPARDGKASGTIKRSSRHPNDSFFTNWTSTRDSIYWEGEVLTSGNYEVEIYYTLAKENIGTELELSFMGEKLSGLVTEVNDPPLKGMENDRVERIESYVKDFKPLKLGKLYLKKGSGTLTLKALKIPGNQAIDFRLLMLKRLGG
jgi:arylsulfatase A-like enzyme